MPKHKRLGLVIPGYDLAGDQASRSDQLRRKRQGKKV
jgi:hypothetical protein